MDQLINKILGEKPVKSVKKRSGPTLRIDLYTRDISGREEKKIPGSLRKISSSIKLCLENAISRNEIKAWNWIQKPKKRYRDRADSLNVSDREPIGYKPAYYTLSIQKND
jgi:hypothetical protein